MGEAVLEKKRNMELCWDNHLLCAAASLIGVGYSLIPFGIPTYSNNLIHKIRIRVDPLLTFL